MFSCQFKEVFLQMVNSLYKGDQFYCFQLLIRGLFNQVYQFCELFGILYICFLFLEKIIIYVQVVLDFCKSVMSELGIDIERMFIGYCVYLRVCFLEGGGIGQLWMGFYGCYCLIICCFNFFLLLNGDIIVFIKQFFY